MDINLEDVEIIEGNRNNLEIKIIVNSEENENNKYLLYFPYEKPPNEANWLLDLELAYHVFQTDKESLYLEELGIENTYRDIVSKHIKFFESRDRRKKLKEIIDTDKSLTLDRILQVVFNSPKEATLNNYLLVYLKALAENKEKRIDNELGKYNLAEFFWSRIKKSFNYQSENPSIYEFAIEIFTSTSSLGRISVLTNETSILLSDWKDSDLYRDSYRELSNRISQELSIPDKLKSVNIKNLVDEDHYEVIDKDIILYLNEEICNERISVEIVDDLIKRRSRTFWFREYEYHYACLKNASKILDLIPKHREAIFSTIDSGITDYAENLFKVDQVYRKFIWAYLKTDQERCFRNLYEKIEKIYSNDWLLTIGNRWQSSVVDRMKWPINTNNTQRSFFKTHVHPYIKKKTRVVVVISDAMRYECAEELSRKIQIEKRFKASIESMIGSLPSYTQLGMASLLPRKQSITVKEGSDSILVDDVISVGIEGRKKILENYTRCRATAIQAEKFLNLENGREFVKSYDVIYIYSNVIDKKGDDKSTESKVFEAVEEEIENLLRLTKKIAAFNGYKIIITSDHGFLYQHEPVEEGDFTEPDINGQIWKENRRFVIGSSLRTDDSCKSFNGVDLGLQSDVDVLIPKSINRLRIKGSGSRFVHGGATLHEVTIPIIKISHKRKDTIRKVNVSIIKTTDRISSNLFKISFIQDKAVSDIVRPRIIRAWISASSERISDYFEYEFDIMESSLRDREVIHIFNLSPNLSSQHNNQQVKLFLEELIPGTTKSNPYKEYLFTLHTMLPTDF